ncbi:Mobile element protein [Pseudomonas sp. R4-39-08]|nr:Mobile element protein [Pseudomonas sp. R4-39-08]
MDGRDALPDPEKLNGVSAEMSLNVLVYNLKRVMKILGTSVLMKALSA